MTKLLLYLLLTPQSALPYIDAVPLDYQTPWQHNIERGKQMGKSCDDCWWAFREGTRFHLTERLLAGDSADDVLYLLGRMQGRSYLWQAYWQNDSPRSPAWIDTLKLEETRQ